MIQTIIFDFDDTIVNSDPLHCKAWDILLHEYGYTFEEYPKELRAKMIGAKVTDNAKEFITYFHINSSLESFSKRKTMLFMSLAKDNLTLLSDVTKTLKFFKNHQLKLALATGGEKFYVYAMLKKFDLEQYFDVIVTNEDVVNGKPHPECYLTALKRMHASPEEALVLEDSARGIIAAKAAGCKCIAIKNVHILPQDLTCADLVVNTLGEITTETLNNFF